MSNGYLTLCDEEWEREIRREREHNPLRPHVRQGQTVQVWGPWSNGHDEQAAMVTQVHGIGHLVNLFIFVDAGEPMIATEVPFYPTRALAMDAMMKNGTPMNLGGPQVAYFHDEV